ncbi:hypothetical protein QA635_04335 [Bradyrhizobium brasilense]|nr:hypothetical protein [Bradyrhizobium australafricanum]WFU33683.1 hypothetical protein QA635_04335 [Bradyrhizobium australafricanum]
MDSTELPVRVDTGSDLAILKTACLLVRNLRECSDANIGSIAAAFRR